LPYQTRRIDLGDSNPADDPDNELRYRYDGLSAGKKYRLHLTLFQGTGAATANHSVAVDEIDTGVVLSVAATKRVDEAIEVPVGTYATDGSIVVRITRTNATTGAFVNEIALEELTLGQGNSLVQNLALYTGMPNWVSFNVKPPVRPAVACAGVVPTSEFTVLAGDVSLAGQPAPANSMIEAFTPAGVKVGCYKVTTPGRYGYMRVYGAEGTVGGMQPGEPVRLKVNGIAVTTTPDSFFWHNDMLAWDLDLAAPDAIPVETFLDPITDRVTKLQSETGMYLPPPGDPIYNSLTTVSPGWGYLLYTNATASLAVSGPPVAADSPLALHAGWNWLGYLPSCELPVQTALASIDGKYDLLHNENGTYLPPPADPSRNNFNSMAPGEGYMIHLLQDVTLTYPTGGCGGAGSSVRETLAGPSDGDACTASPTSRFSNYYGRVLQAGGQLPAGAQIEVLSPRGEVVGCGAVREDGQYGYLRVYGADEAGQGMRAGELPRFIVAGRQLAGVGLTSWSDDLWVHAVNLAPAGPMTQTYLPLLTR
jgi:hypothetical protein